MFDCATEKYRGPATAVTLSIIMCTIVVVVMFQYFRDRSVLFAYQLDWFYLSIARFIFEPILFFVLRFNYRSVAFFFFFFVGYRQNAWCGPSLTVNYFSPPSRFCRLLKILWCPQESFEYATRRRCRSMSNCLCHTYLMLLLIFL